MPRPAINDNNTENTTSGLLLETSLIYIIVYLLGLYIDILIETTRAG